MIHNKKRIGVKMKATFLKNIGRIREDIRRYVRTIWGLSLSWKIVIVVIISFLLPFIIPVLQIGVMAVVPLIGTLLFINDDFDGRKRGVLTFVMGTIAQLITVVMIFSLLAMEGVEGELGLATIISATLSGMFMLSPGYGFAYLFYGLDHKKPDGKVFLLLFVLLTIILGIWNAIAVFR